MKQKVNFHFLNKHTVVACFRPNKATHSYRAAKRLLQKSLHRLFSTQAYDRLLLRAIPKKFHNGDPPAWIIGAVISSYFLLPGLPDFRWRTPF